MKVLEILPETISSLMKNTCLLHFLFFLNIKKRAELTKFVRYLYIIGRRSNLKVSLNDWGPQEVSKSP